MKKKRVIKNTLKMLLAVAGICALVSCVADPVMYTITFNSNGGSLVDQQTAEEGGKITEPADPTKTGFTLTGWYKEEALTTAWDFENDTVASDITLYAKWTVNTYTVTFDKQDGSGGSDSVTAVYGSAMPAATASTRGGFTFGGYFTEESGSGTQYYDGSMTSIRNWDITSDTILYACWIYIEYSIGEPGPAGGLIFYDNTEYLSDGWRYLEAAPAATEWSAIGWGGQGTDIGGDDDQAPPELTAVGSGAENTGVIVAALGDNGGTDYAARLCDELEYEGYGDWFLPSLDELNLMYENLHDQPTPLGGFTGSSSYSYWSSSEEDGTEAWYQYFNADDQQYYDEKDEAAYKLIRAIRAF